MKNSVPALAASSDDSEMRSRILAAAFQVFTSNGYSGATTSAIAERAKVSKRDLYAHFENKQSMLLACIESRTVKMRMHEGLPEPHDRDMLASTLLAFAANVLTESTHPAVTAMFRLAISEADRSPEVAQALDECRKVNRGVLADFLASAQTAGLLAAGDAAAMADQCMALVWEDLMLGLLLGVLQRPSVATLQRKAGKAIDVFLKQHSTPAPIRPARRANSRPRP